jgi:hypothetical protein
MAQRPIFLPSKEPGRLVEEVSVEFLWHKGMAPSQKQKNVAELHGAALKAGIAPLLEVSTKSREWIGYSLSAFNLLVDLGDGTRIPLESAFQGSKVFTGGGPFIDLFGVDGRRAKRDLRLTSSGTLQEFNFQGVRFPLLPRTAFYDWLYIRAVFQETDFHERLDSYAGFTDIEFNPAKSINCQARSCATFVSLAKLQLLESCIDSSTEFISLLAQDSAFHQSQTEQDSLFS